MENAITHRRKVLLLIPHVGGGGAERVITLLAQHLSHDKYEVHLGLITQTNVAPNEVPNDVTVHALGASRVRFAALPLLRLVWQLKPDVILSGMMHLNSLVLLLRRFLPRGTRVLVRQDSTFSAALSFAKLPRGTRLLHQTCYPKADSIICQTQAMAFDLATELRIPQELLAVLPNPIDVETLRASRTDIETQWSGPGPHLLAIGRLSPEKGFDLLLDAFAKVRESFPTADLVIAGCGPEDAALKAHCDKLELAGSVRFAGYVEHPEKYFAGASAFVLSSRHEGLPNAMLEAAGGGLPIVALPSSDGVKDLLQGQPGVWLALEISSDALAATLLSAFDTLLPDQRFEYEFVEQFSIDRAIRAYENLIDAILSEHGQ